MPPTPTAAGTTSPPSSLVSTNDNSTAIGRRPPAESLLLTGKVFLSATFRENLVGSVANLLGGSNHERDSEPSGTVGGRRRHRHRGRCVGAAGAGVSLASGTREAGACVAGARVVEAR